MLSYRRMADPGVWGVRAVFRLLSSGVELGKLIPNVNGPGGGPVT